MGKRNRKKSRFYKKKPRFSSAGNHSDAVGAPNKSHEVVNRDSKSSGKLRRIKPIVTTVITIFASIGGFEGLKAGYEWMFRRPELTIRPSLGVKSIMENSRQARHHYRKTIFLFAADVYNSGSAPLIISNTVLKVYLPDSTVEFEIVNVPANLNEIIHDERFLRFPNPVERDFSKTDRLEADESKIYYL